MPGRRATGRILSLGFPLPGTQVDNYNFVSAPAFFDYEALVVDPASLARLIAGVVDGSVAAQTFAGAAARLRPEHPGEEALVDVLLQRRDETEMLLHNGSVIVCFAVPAQQHALAEGQTLDDYYWLPDDVAALCRAPALVPADGTQVHVVDYQHPLAAFVVSQAANIGYRARFVPPHVPLERVFVQSAGGAPLAVDLTPSGGGRVVLLPALNAIPSGEARYAMSERLQAGVRRVLGTEAQGIEPPWLRTFTLPGLDERKRALDDAHHARDEAQRALDEAQQAYDELVRWRRLLWQEGTVGFDQVVLDALRLIGFTIYDTDPNALEVRAGTATAMLEIDASERPVDLAPHYRLRQRIERALARRSGAVRGLLVVNGQRLTPPDKRGEELSPALRSASETMRYCIAPSSGLYEAVRAKLEGRDDDVTAYRCRLLEEDGVVRCEQASGGEPA